MKKKVVILSVLLVASQWIIAGTKLNPDIYSFVSVWGQVGGSTLLNNSGSSVKPGLGVSPSIGMGYQWHRNDFVMQVGLEAQYAYWTNKLSTTNFSLPMLDTENDAFVMTAQLHDGKDWVHNINVVVPLLFGYEHQRFYFLAGPEFAYSVYASTTSRSLLNTLANYYGKFMDDFENMPNHQLRVNETTTSGSQKLSIKSTVYAHAEVGVRLGEVERHKGANVNRKNYRLYLSLFADYGVLNIHTNTANGQVVSYEEKESEGVRFYVVPAMVSAELNDAKVNPLTVGVKFTASFQLPKLKTWMIYDATGNKNYRRVRGKSQFVIY